MGPPEPAPRLRMPASASGWRGALLAAALSLAAGGVAAGTLAELWLRFAHPIESPAALRARSLEYEGVAWARHALSRRRGGPVVAPAGANEEINGRGTRGPDFAPVPPSGVTRVLVLGGSAAFDADAPPGQDWPRRAEAELRARGLAQVEVINAAVPGHATADSLGRFATELWMVEPDFVVVYHAWNDIKSFRWLSADRPLLRGVRPPPVRADGRVDNPFLYERGGLDRVALHSQLYRALRRRFFEWRLGMIGAEGLVGAGRDAAARRRAGEGGADEFGPDGPRQYGFALRLIADAVRDAGGEPLFATQARLVARDNGPAEIARLNLAYAGLSHAGAVRAFAACDAALREAAAAEGVEVLDLSRGLTGRPELFLDHVHPSAEGSRALAAALADGLEPRLRAAAAAAGRAEGATGVAGAAPAAARAAGP